MIVPAPEHPQLEKYEVLEEIGHGGMATVYRAHDKRLARDVAIKVIHRHLRESREIAARFVSEARAVAKLKHPNIVEVYDVSDEDSDERYLVVELVRGPTLRKLLADTGHMPAEVAAALGIEIGRALDHAHEQGVVHRDVKPENVLLELRDSPLSNRTSGERTSEETGPCVKITDFGIAKLLDAQGVTSTGQVLGSPAHMAPEQIEGGEVSPRADVFGLGVLLYECMVGRLPFDGKNPAQVLRRVLDGTFTPPDRARPTIGAQLSRIVEKALAREADDRFASAAELCDALRAELERVGMTDHRRELAEYLSGPKAYFEEYEPRIVERLVELGKQARAERQLPAAATFFNRALAFRPDDTELIKQVAGLAQTERLKRVAARAAAIVAGSAVLGVIAFGVTRAIREPQVLPEEPRTSVSREPRVSPITPPITRNPKPPSSAKPEEEPEPKKSSSKHLPLSPFESPKTGGKRRVQIIVLGATGSRVLVDGKGVEHLTERPEYEIGTSHVVTVQLPKDNPQCCDKPDAVSFTVQEGTDPQPVYVNVPFREAAITVQGEAGVVANCPTLHNGSIQAGQVIKIKVAQAMLPGTCTITGPTPDSPPKSAPVELRPGTTTVISY